jgi:hypothetical protein
MSSGYLVSCTTCGWDDGYFSTPEEADSAAEMHRLGDNEQHSTTVEEVP